MVRYSTERKRIFVSFPKILGLISLTDCYKLLDDWEVIMKPLLQTLVNLNCKLVNRFMSNLSFP